LLLADPPELYDTVDQSGFEGPMITPEPSWIDLAVSLIEVCALDEVGAMWCGDGERMQLEDQGPFVSISAGETGGICAVYETGLLRCGFGYSSADFELPEDYVAVSGGSDNGCGLRASGHARCWPKAASVSGPFGSLGAGNRFACGILRGSGILTCWAIDSLIFEESLSDVPPGRYTRVATHGNVGCAISSTGAIRCWGYDFDDLLPGPASDNYVDLALTTGGACAVTETGSIVCWGEDTTDPNNSEFFPPTDESFVRVALDWGWACGITTDSRLVCWGD